MLIVKWENTDYKKKRLDKLSSHEKTGEEIKCILIKRSQYEKATYYMIPTIRHWKKKYESSKKIKGCKKERLIGNREFLGQWNSLYGYNEEYLQFHNYTSKRKSNTKSEL